MHLAPVGRPPSMPDASAPPDGAERDQTDEMVALAHVNSLAAGSFLQGWTELSGSEGEGSSIGGRASSVRSASEALSAHFMSYIPLGVALRYAAMRPPLPPSKPERRELDGVVGFIDVSGFTALAEKLSQESGRKGAELLNQYMNTYFDQLIENVASSAGDVVKFAGDALQVVWREGADGRTSPDVGIVERDSKAAVPAAKMSDAPPTSAKPEAAVAACSAAGAHVAQPGASAHASVPSSAEAAQTSCLAPLVLHAAQCCANLLADLNNFSPVNGVVLTLHIGLGVGKLTEFVVGGHAGKWEHFIAGEPIQQMAEATDAAGSGQLVLSKAASELLYEAIRLDGCPVMAVGETLAREGMEDGLLLLHGFKPACGSGSTTARADSRRISFSTLDVGGISSVSFKKQSTREAAVHAPGELVSPAASPVKRTSSMKRKGSVALNAISKPGRCGWRSILGSAPLTRNSSGAASCPGNSAASTCLSRTSSTVREEDRCPQPPPLTHSLSVPSLNGSEDAESPAATVSNSRHDESRRFSQETQRRSSLALEDSRRSSTELPRRSSCLNDDNRLSAQEPQCAGRPSRQWDSSCHGGHEAQRSRRSSQADESRHGANDYQRARSSARRVRRIPSYEEQENGVDTFVGGVKRRFLRIAGAGAPGALLPRLQPTGLLPLERVQQLMPGADAIKEVQLALRCFVPALVEERIRAGQAGLLLSEHRVITTVFFKLLNLGERPCEPKALDVTHQAVRIVQERVAYHGGAILRLITDDKGTRFLIAFGLPGQQHGNDVTRAVVASAEAAQRLSGIQVSDGSPSVLAAAGITTGRVFCGEAGSDFRREYTLAGSAVNMAARLMQAAHRLHGDGILVDQPTYESVTLDTSAFEVLEPIKVKGRDEPMPVFRPLPHAIGATGRRDVAHAGLAGTAGRQRDGRGQALKSTIGRRPELNVIREALEDLRSERGGGVLLVGEAGMGKTHLVNVLQEIHGTRVGVFAEAATYRSDGFGDAFQAWRSIFGRLLTPTTIEKLARVAAFANPRDLPSELQATLTHPRSPVRGRARSEVLAVSSARSSPSPARCRRPAKGVPSPTCSPGPASPSSLPSPSHRRRTPARLSSPRFSERALSPSLCQRTFRRSSSPMFGATRNLSSPSAPSSLTVSSSPSLPSLPSPAGWLRGQRSPSPMRPSRSPSASPNSPSRARRSRNLTISPPSAAYASIPPSLPASPPGSPAAELVLKTEKPRLSFPGGVADSPSPQGDASASAAHLVVVKPQPRPSQTSPASADREPTPNVRRLDASQVRRLDAAKVQRLETCQVRRVEASSWADDSQTGSKEPSAPQTPKVHVSSTRVLRGSARASTTSGASDGNASRVPATGPGGAKPALCVSVDPRTACSPASVPGQRSTPAQGSLGPALPAGASTLGPRAAQLDGGRNFDTAASPRDTSGGGVARTGSELTIQSIESPRLAHASEDSRLSEARCAAASVADRAPSIPSRGSEVELPVSTPSPRSAPPAPLALPPALSRGASYSFSSTSESRPSYMRPIGKLRPQRPPQPRSAAVLQRFPLRHGAPAISATLSRDANQQSRSGGSRPWVAPPFGDEHEWPKSSRLPRWGGGESAELVREAPRLGAKPHQMLRGVRKRMQVRPSQLLMTDSVPTAHADSCTGSPTDAARGPPHRRKLEMSRRLSTDTSPGSAATPGSSGALPPASAARQLWWAAYSTVQAYVLPLREVQTRGFCVRPNVDWKLTTDPCIAALSPLLNPVLSRRIENNAVTQRLTGEARVRAAVYVMARVLAVKLGGAASILIFEDADAVDGPSWALLKAVMAQVQPLLCVVSLQPDRARPSVGHEPLELFAPERRLTLQSFVKAEIDALLCAALNTPQVPARLVDFVTSKSDGNPLYALEICRTLLQNGVIARGADAEYDIDPDANLQHLELPSSVEALLTSRIDRLPPAQQLWLKISSVLGTHITTQALRQISRGLPADLAAGPRAELRRSLDGLCEAGMLQQANCAEVSTARYGEYALRFTHGSVQHVAYSLLPEELKEKLHAAAARFYESMLEQRTERSIRSRPSTGSRGFPRPSTSSAAYANQIETSALLRTLQHHWQRAGDAPYPLSQSVRYLSEGADQALESFDPSEAQRLSVSAMTLVKRHQVLSYWRGPLLRRMGKSSLLTGETAAARRFLNEALFALGETRQSPSAMTGPWLTLAIFRARLLVFGLHLRRRAREPSVGVPLVWGDKPVDYRLEKALALESLGRAELHEGHLRRATLSALRSLIESYRLPYLSIVTGDAYELLSSSLPPQQRTSRAARLYIRRSQRVAQALGKDVIMELDEEEEDLLSGRPSQAASV